MQSKKEKLKSAINLINLMPPSKMKKNQVGLINLAPQIQENLLQKIDLPHSIEMDTVVNLPFIRTQFNRDGEAYRSPYSNTYFPQHPQGYCPDKKLRRLEEIGGGLFKEYTRLYYEGGVGNFLVSGDDEDLSEFSCGFFAKKQCDSSQGHIGNWDSFNILDVKTEGNQVTYKLNTTVLIQMKISSEKVGDIDISGYYRKGVKETQTLPLLKKETDDDIAFHISNIGRIIQDLETNMRKEIEALYVTRTKQIIFTTRFEYTRELEEKQAKMASSFMNLKA